MKARKWLAIAVSLGMLAMAGCSDKDPVSSTAGPMDDATSAAKLVISKTKAGGRCEIPPCVGSTYWGNGTTITKPKPAPTPAPTPTPTPTPETPATTPKTLTATLPGGATMEFVRIEPGTFMMGAPTTEPLRAENEELPHQVTISKGFYLGKFEITQGQWKAVMGTQPWAGKELVQENPRNPAVWVSWDDLQEFARQMNSAAGTTIYRLPTAAEWEYACRAGTTTEWSFGDDVSQLGEYAWYDQNAYNVGEQYAHTVGTKKPNPWGLYDMHGNVGEWVQDWYHYVPDPRIAEPEGPSTDPQGPSAGTARGVRGGDFHERALFTRSARFDAHGPDLRIIYVGARLVRTK